MAACRRIAVVLTGSQRAKEIVPLVEQANLQATTVSTTADALSCVRELGERSLACVILALGTGAEDSCWPVLAELHTGGAHQQIFVIVLSNTAERDVAMRLQCFAAGARMVTASNEAVGVALRKVAAVVCDPGPYSCPACGLAGLSENALHLHMPFHHATEANPSGSCPICRKSVSCLPVHINNEHGPAEHREPPTAPFAAFAWCVGRRRDGKFLLVNEPAGISRGKPGYWLPAGRVDRGESLVEAAQRECLEEAGVEVRVLGVLRFMLDSGGTPRVVFLTEPMRDDAVAKSVPDWESVGAVWADVADLAALGREDYRSPDPAELYPKVASGELTPHSLDTDAFRSLEVLIKQLTLGSKSALHEFPKVWAQLQQTYPVSAFDRS